MDRPVAKPKTNLAALRSDIDSIVMKRVKNSKPRKGAADLRIYWSKREKALIYDGVKQTGGMLSAFFERARMLDIYDMRHGLAAKLHHPDESDERTLVQELEARGYDLTTLRFQIRKKPTP
jgi:hypothetical protein